MIVLPAGQLLHQSSAGILSSNAESWNGCVCVACLVVRVRLFCAALHLSPAASSEKNCIAQHGH